MIVCVMGTLVVNGALLRNRNGKGRKWVLRIRSKLIKTKLTTLMRNPYRGDFSTMLHFPRFSNKKKKKKKNPQNFYITYNFYNSRNNNAKVVYLF